MARKTGKGESHTGRLRYPEDRKAMAETAALPLDEQRGQRIPRKLDDPNVRGIVIGAAAFADSVEAIASLAGVAPSSIYDLRKRDEAFEQQWQTARARQVLTWELTMGLVARTPTNPRCVDAGKFMLAAHKPEVYRQKTEIEVSTSVADDLSAVGEKARARRAQRLADSVAVEIIEQAAGGNGHGDAVALLAGAVPGDAEKK